MIHTSENDIKERLSLGFVTLVAARAGCRVQTAEPDRDSVDITLRPVKGEPVVIDAQLKSSSNLKRDGEYILFDLPVNNYNDLRETVVGVPRILIVLDLHQDTEMWLRCADDTVALNRMGYWLDLHDADPTTNTTRKRVRLPLDQPFTPEELRNMMQRRHHNLQHNVGGVS